MWQVYRVVLKSKKDGSWIVMFFAEKRRLWTLPFRKEGAAIWTAAKLCDEMKVNGCEFGWDVQNEKGRTVKSVNLVKRAQRQKEKGR